MNFPRLPNGPNEVHINHLLSFVVVFFVASLGELKPPAMNSSSLSNALNEAHTTTTSFVDTAFVIFSSAFFSSFFLGWIFWIGRSSVPVYIKYLLFVSYVCTSFVCVYCVTPVYLLLVSYFVACLASFLVVLFFLKGERFGVLAVFVLVFLRSLNALYGWAFITSYSIVLYCASYLTRAPPLEPGELVEADLAPMLQFQGEGNELALPEGFDFGNLEEEMIPLQFEDFGNFDHQNNLNEEELILLLIQLDMALPIERSPVR